MLPLLSKYIQYKIFKDVKSCPLMLFIVVILPRQTYNDPLFRSKGSPAHSFIFRDFISPEQGYVNFSSHANKIWFEVMLFTTKDCHEYLIQTGASFLLSASLSRRSDQHIFVSSLRIFSWQSETISCLCVCKFKYLCSVIVAITNSCFLLQYFNHVSMVEWKKVLSFWVVCL